MKAGSACRVYAPPYGGVGAFLWEAVRFKCAGFLIKTGEPFRCGFPAKVRKNDENGKKPLFTGGFFCIMRGGFFGKSRAGGALESRLSLPHLCSAIWRRGILWEVGTSYNERRLLWEAVCFVWAVTCVRRIPRRRREEGAGSASPLLCAAIWRRGILWEAMHFIMRGIFD